MTTPKAGFKVSDVRQGGVALGLSEYTSREGRLQLVKAAHEAITEELRRRRANGDLFVDKRIGASSLLARSLGVTKRTVERWVSGGIQACNVNAERLIEVALSLNPEWVIDILEEDLERHRFEFSTMTSKVRQGDVAHSKVEVIA